jgi:hypothetical protein
MRFCPYYHALLPEFPNRSHFRAMWSTMVKHSYTSACPSVITNNRSMLNRQCDTFKVLMTALSLIRQSQWCHHCYLHTFMNDTCGVRNIMSTHWFWGPTGSNSNACITMLRAHASRLSPHTCPSLVLTDLLVSYLNCYGSVHFRSECAPYI